jgi:hypothetical protein
MRYTKLHQRIRGSENAPHPSPTELAFTVGIVGLIALCIALLAQWALPSQG